jgi:predicted permease
MKFWKRVRMWRDRRRFEQDLAEEVRIHREMAGAAAFGSEALALEQSRDVWGFTWLESWKQDIRYALRGLRRSPGFTLAVVGAIGLGIGLNTTLFTVVNAYAFRPYMVRDPYSLYSFTWYAKNGNGHFFSSDDYESARAERRVFSDVIAYDNFGGELSGRLMFAQLVTENYFDFMGTRMELGRPLVAGDRAAAVMGYEAWRNKFGGDPSIVGRKLYLRGQPLEIVGVAGRRFTGVEGLPVGVWVPMSMHTAFKDGAGNGGLRLRLIGRLQPGLTEERAKAALTTWAARRWPDASGVAMTRRATAVPLNRDAILTFIPLFVAFGIVLAIACANVSNMMLARALARQREMAIRVSLGAGRARLVRQLLTESLLLAIPSAIGGFLISIATLEAARRLLFATVPAAFGQMLAIEDLRADWRVFGYLLAASLGTALLFGLAPALITTRNRLVEASRGDFSSDYRPARMRNLLVVAQVGVCSLLLICAAIVLRGEARVTGRDLGIDVRGVWDIRMLSRFQEKAARRLSALPGAETVVAAWHAPVYGTMRRMALHTPGRRDEVEAGFNFVSGGYFSLFRIPVLRGRTFTTEESQSEAAVVVVTEAAARRLWPGGEALGQAIDLPAAVLRQSPFDRMPSFHSARVVGVVKDVRTDLNGEDAVSVYFPTSPRTPGNDSVLVRMKLPRAEAQRALQAALDEVGLSIADQINPMEDVAAVQVYPFRVTFWVAGFLGGVALLMTISGIYGVMSYVVSQRTKEIGIRVALGAGQSEIVRMILRQSARLAGYGAAGGVAVALALAPLVANQLEAIRPYEWLPYAGGAIAVLGAALAASLAPSRRAVRIDPIVTLRCD